MLRKLKAMFGGGGHDESKAPPDLITLDREEIGAFIAEREGLPRIDWGGVDMWIERKTREPGPQAVLRRGAAAAWLDGVRDSLENDHKRWRHARIEGLAPVADGLAQRIAGLADRALVTVEKTLAPVLGVGRVAPVAVVALQTTEAYYSFIAHHYAEEGEWGTSGGIYINEGESSFPILALPVSVKHGIAETLAHELTHHALWGMEMPVWVEEGFTQMMEERVAGRTGFVLNREMLERHRDHWEDESLSRFVAGEAFHSSRDDEQELAYHLSQLAVRGWLSREPGRFFAFARACRDIGPQAAAAEHLGGTEEEVVRAAIGG